MSTKPNHARVYAKVPPFLRGMREDAKLTQRQLAAKTKKPQWWIARIETGSRRVDVAEFLVFCEGCGVDPAQALTELSKARR
jgi:transcriptional regulator with XRE-family HTH domain